MTAPPRGAAVDLDARSVIDARDPHGVRDVLAGFGRQCRDAVTLGVSPALRGGRPRVVVVAAMGGSAASGDVLAAAAADRLDVPILVHRDYGLPAAAAGDALVIASSYSGQTAEVLSAVETAHARGVPLVAVTSGGDLAAFAERHRHPRVALPPGLMPRMALGYLFFPLLAILAGVGLEVASEAEIAEAVGVVDELGRELGPARPTGDNEAKQIALAMADRTPAVYGGPLTGRVAYRWKTELAENAKVLGFAAALPEMNHNEIEAWQGPLMRRVQAVLLRDHGERPEIARRFALLRELLVPAGAGVVETWTRGKEPLARLLSLGCVGTWTSFYLAMLRGVDPWPVPVLEALKRRLAS
jgi:glucose/mannose-6-phosphate isomerase